MTRTSPVLALLFAFAAMLVASNALAEDDPSAAPFRAKLVFNVALAKKGASSLTAIAKQSPPKHLSQDERKAWSEQSKVLAAGAARLTALKQRMDAVLAKPHAGASELVLINLELGNAQRVIEDESQRHAVTNATKTRHEAAMKSIR